MHRHHAAVAAVNAFDFAGDQTIGDVRPAKAAVLFWNRDAQEAHGPHFAKNGGVGGFVAVSGDDAGLQLFLRVGPRGVAHHAFIFGQLVFHSEGVLPIKAAKVGGVFGFEVGFGWHVHADLLR